MEKTISINECKSGMIAFSGGNHFIQRAIRFFTKSKFSHSFLILDGPFKVLSAFETTSTITTTAPLADKLKEDDWIEVYDVVATDVEKNNAAKETYEQYSSVWYGYLSYIWFMWRWFCRLLYVEKTTMWKWCSNNTTCTELTCHYLFKLHSQFSALFTEKDFNTLSPQELVAIKNAHPELFKFVGWLKKPYLEKGDANV